MGMDISPAPMPPLGRSRSSGNTPVSHNKRTRDDDGDYMNMIAEQALHRQKLVSPGCTPRQSPRRDGSGAAGESALPCYGTPLAGSAAGEGASQALRLGLRFASHQRQGPRAAQEDCVVCRMDEREFPHGYFGVFDGHGGAIASEHCAARLHDHVLASEHCPSDVLSALQDGFLRTDAELLRRAAAPPRRKDDDCGTAAVVMPATADGLALAHAGDCRAILVKRSGAQVPFVALDVASRLPACRPVGGRVTSRGP